MRDDRDESDARALKSGLFQMAGAGAGAGPGAGGGAGLNRWASGFAAAVG